ncbi:SRPBCC domain-containing protein [Nocardia sp. NPDC059177]|uniref:SRPBCC family protein n=1 Tax=Nocardia sp. NPDC059177 TaxID=3346759 RepID=UPI0036B433DF
MIADTRLDPAKIELGSFFPQSPEVVWHALTEPELLARWLLRPIGFAATVGTHFRFAIPDATIDEITCEVLAARPRERLAYTWIYPQLEQQPRWIVDWTLYPQGQGTRLLLTHTGFDVTDRRQKMMRNALERGWKRLVLPRLGDVIHH